MANFSRNTFALAVAIKLNAFSFGEDCPLWRHRLIIPPIVPRTIFPRMTCQLPIFPQMTFLLYFRTHLMLCFPFRCCRMNLVFSTTLQHFSRVSSPSQLNSTPLSNKSTKYIKICIFIQIHLPFSSFGI